MDRDLEQWKAREVARLLALVETERRYYQEIVASIPVGIFILSSDLSIISSNREVRRIFGLRSGEPIRGTLDQFLPDTVIEKVRETVQTGAAHDKITVPVPDEPLRVLRVSMRQIGNWDDEPAQEALVTIEDSPAQKVAAQQDAGLPFPDMIESLDAIIWAAELSTKRFLFVSEQAVGLLGYPVEHWLNTPTFWNDRVLPEDREHVSEEYGKLLNGSNHATCEFQALTALGEVLWLRESVRVLQDGQGSVSHLIGLAVNVTQRRMLDAQFIRAQRAEAVNRLSARMSTEITNQAMIVAGYSEDMLAALESKSPLRADVREIQAAAERLRSLATRMTSAHRVQAEATEPLDAAELLRRMETDIRKSLGEVGFELNVLPPVLGVRADAHQLEQVISAFVQRARRDLRAGQKLAIDCAPFEFEERSERNGIRPGVYGVIRIEDNGPTLEPNVRAGLFDGIWNGHDGEVDPALSMARAYRVVRQWGGDISVSANSPGTVVEIYLPRAGETALAPALETVKAPTPEPEPEPAHAPAPTVETPAPPPAPRQPTILVVEGEGGIRTLIQKMLRRQGYQVLDAANSSDALKLCEQNSGKIDLLVADASARPMASHETLDHIRQFCPGVKPLYLVGDVDDQLIQLPAHAASLAKPFTLGSLINKVKELLGDNLAEPVPERASPAHPTSTANPQPETVTAKAPVSQ